MFGALIASTRKWKNCPTSLHGMYFAHIYESTIVLKVEALYDLWILQVFFRLLGLVMI